VAARLVERIQWWERHVAADGSSLDNNPSPGNKAGGLTTILEKSLGAVAKGGRADLAAVYEYAERMAPHQGFVFMDTPGYDPVSVTGLVAGGANVVVFTTGRGSVFGTVAGALLVGVLDNILQLNDIDSNVQLIVVGVVIVLAAGLQRLRPATA
jgi:altronate hydrolase